MLIVENGEQACLGVPEDNTAHRRADCERHCIEQANGERLVVRIAERDAGSVEREQGSSANASVGAFNMRELSCAYAVC